MAIYKESSLLRTVVVVLQHNKNVNMLGIGNPITYPSFRRLGVSSSDIYC